MLKAELFSRLWWALRLNKEENMLSSFRRMLEAGFAGSATYHKRVPRLVRIDQSAFPF
jgi:hypothetical protein